MHFEAALNLLWVSLGLLAFAITARSMSGRRRRAVGRIHPRAGLSGWLHVIGVCLIVVALFPYVSATDDVLRIEHFNAQTDQHAKIPGKHSQTDNLILLYKTMDAPLVCTVREIVLVFFFISLVFTPVPRLLERMQPQESGRSPPALPSPPIKN